MASVEILRSVKAKPRILIISDISNEPDDAESLVRFLLYCNEFDLRGLVPCTSTWMKRVVHPEDMQKIIDAYSQVVANLNKHVHPNNQYPSASYLTSILKLGPPVYGQEALEPGYPLSEGSKLLIENLDESEDPLWVLCWGGTNVLASALQHISQSRPESSFAAARKKLRVYAISDQDDTGAWIRTKFPDVFYICSVHGWNQYGCATWTGISGDKYYGFDQGGPDFTKMTKEWIKSNIQVGPLGNVYPDYLFIPEGDTPTFLYLIQNGLSSPENPEWGSWGGRYLPNQEGGRQYHDAVDRVKGQDGKMYSSNHATIWRWRDAFQNDFAARMQWTLTNDTSKCNHHPVAIVNDDSTIGHVAIESEAETEVSIDASKSYDPDGDELTYKWFQYKDITATQWWVDAEVPDIAIVPQNAVGSIVKVKLPPAEKCAVDMFTGEPKLKGQAYHFILELRDNGSPSLITYRRIVVQTTNKELKGRRGKAVDSIADVHEST